ncbi:MAG: TIR domain-containing protein [Cellulosilyticaceae bacterium]
MNQKVFISYSSRDSEVAQHICHLLEAKEIPCWIAPRNITAGKEWGEQIIQGIEGSQILVLVFSQYSNESQQVLREVERAISKKLVVIAFRIEDVLPTKSMEYFLYSNHWLDAFDGSRDEKIEELAGTIHRVLENMPEDRPVSIDYGHARNYLPKKKPKWLKGIGMGLIVIGLVAIAFNLNAIRVKLSEQEVIQPAVDAPNQTTSSSVEPVIQVPDSSVMTTSSEQQDSEGVGEAIEKSETNQEVIHQETKPQTSPENNVHTQTSTPQAVPEGEHTSDNKEVTMPTVSVGQIMRFGFYNHESIDWMIIDVDDKGNPLLLAKDIISLKSLDAAESGQYNQSKDGTKFDSKKEKALIYTDYTNTQLREMKGSNDWKTSNLREWLNSGSKTINYTTGAPTATAVGGGTNDYSKEPGFLAYFSEAEKKAILPVQHKSVLSQVDQGRKSGGSEAYAFSRTEVGQSLFNYSKAYYEQTEDKVFLLSVDELLTYIVDRGWNPRVGLSVGAIEKDKSGWYKDLKGQTGGYHMWWLRTPDANTSSEVCVVGHKGDIIYTEFAAQPGVGVRPALKLNLQGSTYTGSGTEENPFVLDK